MFIEEKIHFKLFLESVTLIMLEGQLKCVTFNFFFHLFFCKCFIKLQDNNNNNKINFFQQISEMCFSLIHFSILKEYQLTR